MDQQGCSCPTSSEPAAVSVLSNECEPALTTSPNRRAKIVSPEGKPLPPGSVGELWSRSPSNAIECEWSEYLYSLSDRLVDSRSHSFFNRPRQ